MLRLLALALLCLLAASPARAEACGVTIGNIAFGAVDSLYSSPIDSVSSIQVECNQVADSVQTVVVCVALGGGSGGHGNGVRRMASGARTLDFQLYRDSNRSIDWGSSTLPELGSAQRFEIAVSGETASGTLTLYGRVFGSQIGAGAGSYSSAFAGIDASFTHAENTLDCDQPGGAAGAQAAFGVSATVSPNCLVEAGDIAFGEHALITSNVDAEGAIDITCTPGTDYSVTLGGGLRNSNDPEQRVLQSGSDQAIYGLYQDDARSQPWGSSLETQLPGTGAGTRQSVVVYGRVPPQPLRPGTYTDTVNVTITYDDAP